MDNITEVATPTRKAEDIVGKRFGRLTVEARLPMNRHGAIVWMCRCDCGGSTKADRQALRSGNTKSCGCLKREIISASRSTHGMSDSRTYRTWTTMRARCTYESVGAYKHYGGRGIKVCDRWGVFENFYADMGDRPAGLSLERKNVNGNYEPDNCVWASNKEQGRNRRNNRLITLNGTALTAMEWSERLGIPRTTIMSRRRLGWTDREILTTPRRPDRLELRRSKPMRRRPNAMERTAAALLAIKRGDGWLIPEPLRSTGTAKEICSHVEWHHNTPHAIGGTTAPQNMTPLPVAEHAIETAKKTIPTVRKGLRLSAAQEEFRRRMLVKTGQAVGVDVPPLRKKKSRPMGYRKFDGTPVAGGKKR
jgi:hypothetical protein